MNSLWLRGRNTTEVKEVKGDIKNRGGKKDQPMRLMDNHFKMLIKKLQKCLYLKKK